MVKYPLNAAGESKVQNVRMVMLRVQIIGKTPGWRPKAGNSGLGAFVSVI
jgi:hypothetical protein